MIWAMVASEALFSIGRGGSVHLQFLKNEFARDLLFRFRSLRGLEIYSSSAPRLRARLSGLPVRIANGGSGPACSFLHWSQIGREAS